MTKIEPIKLFKEAQVSKTEGDNKPKPLVFDYPKELTPEERKSNEKKAIEQLKKDGYKLTPEDGGTFILEDVLGRKSKITGLGLNEKGNVRFDVLTVQIIDPSQKERFHKKTYEGKTDTPEEKEKYAKQAMDIVKRAGYKIEDQGDGRYILTNPEGRKSLVTDFDIAYDGGATWKVLPVYIKDDNFNAVFEPY